MAPNILTYAQQKTVEEVASQYELSPAQQHAVCARLAREDDMNSLDWPKVSYKHKTGRDDIRFVQYAKDRLPDWAIDVQSAPTDRERFGSGCDLVTLASQDTKMTSSVGLRGL